MSFQTGSRVRLRNDPGRIGVVLDNTREQRGLIRRQIQFTDGVQYVPEDQLEAAGAGQEDPLDLFQSGKLGDALDLRRTLTHERLTGRLANIIYSMDTTGTDFYAYQFKPVVKLLNSASRGILIADEVGLGKTIEAGLLWTELRSRFDYRRLLVVCPAMLREKWKMELQQRFGVAADIMDAGATLARLKQAAEEGQTAQFGIVASIQGLRPRRGWEQAEREADGGPSSQLVRFLESREHEDPLIDVCIVDEAHYLRNPETMTAALGRVLRSVSEYVVLLSATPIHLRSGDLFQLLNLVDEDTFDRQQAFDDILEANAPLVRAREMLVSRKVSAEMLQRELEQAAAHPLLEGNRQLESILSAPPDDESLQDPKTLSQLSHRLERVNLLGHVVTRTRKREVKEWRVVREAQAEEVPLRPVERNFYNTVTKVVRDYCMRREVHEGFLLVTPQRQMSSSMPAALRFWQSGGRLEENEFWEDLGVLEDDAAGEDEERPLVQELVRRANEMADLDELWAEDSKYRRLKTLLKSFVAENPDEKVVLFSYFRATLHYLHERLHGDAIRSVILHGGVKDKESTLASFRDAEGSVVLLSSEVGSEGIDLQFSHVVINYDLPWNPMRVEQRIGRLDRLGQKAEKVSIWNFFYEDTIDSRIYRRLYERLQIFEGALGALEPVLGDKIQGLTADLLRAQLTPAQEEERIEQTQLALENIRRHEEELESEASHLVAYGDYILNEVNAARELSRTITATDIRTYVTDFFKVHYPGTEFRQIGDDLIRFEVGLSSEAKADFARFNRRNRLEGSTQLTRNDLQRVRCRFENSAVPRARAREETLSQFHPLVRFVSDRIQDLEDQRRPAVAVRLKTPPRKSSIAPGVYAFSVQRWTVSGLRDTETLHFAAVSLLEPQSTLDDEDAERLVGSAASEGKDWLEAGSTVSLERAGRAITDHCLAPSEEAFEIYRSQLRDENEDRADVQERTLEQHFENQMRKLEEVRDRHRRLERAALVGATEGRIRALEGRVARRRIEIAARRVLRERSEDICVGVVYVGNAEFKE